MRRATMAPAAAVLLAAPTLLAFFSGGYFEEPRLWAAMGACVLALLAAVCAPRPLPRARAGRVALAGMALLVVWSAVSVAWAPIANAAYGDVERLLLYLAGLVAAAALIRPAIQVVEPVLAAGIAVVVGYGLSERLLPGAVHLSHSFSALGRFEQPLTYWNAMGALAALGVVLCTRMAGDVTRPTALRSAAAAAAVPLALGIYLSFSRGALGATAVGVLVLVLLTPTRPQLRAVAIVICTAVPAAIVADNLSWVTSLHAGVAERERQGALMFVVLAALAVAAAAATVAVSRRERPGRASRDRLLPRLAGRIGVLAAAVAIVALALGIAALGERHVTRGPATAGATAQRLATFKSNRYEYWRVAADAFLSHPLIGVGSSGFAVEWLQHRPNLDPARDAHSLYVETAAELGVVGLLAIGMLVGGVAAAARRALARAPAAAAGPTAALAVWAVHAGLDWDWEMPALSLVAIVLMGLVIAIADDAPGAYAEPR